MSATNIDPNDINIEDAPSADAIRGFYEGMRPFWHPVLRSEDLSLDEPVGVQLLGRRLVLARLDGAVAALASLRGPAAAAVADWLDDARARLAPERGLKALHAHAVRVLARDGGPAP